LRSALSDFATADDAGGLSPGKEDNAAVRKKDRKDIHCLVSNRGVKTHRLSGGIRFQP
jgi:hypothetical protein